MSTSYPSGLDNFTNPSGTQTLDSPDHAAQHANVNDAVEAIQTTLGTTAGTSVLKNFSAGQFAARTNNETFGTPTVTGGTANSIVLGTPTLTLGSDATGDLFYRSAGGTATRLAIGSSGQFLTTNGTTPSWGAVTTTSPSFSVSRSAVQGIADDSWVKIQFDTEAFDTNTNYDNATNYRFTPTVAGKYLLTMSVRTAAAVGDGKYLAVAIYKNGSEYKISYQFDGHASAISSSSVTDVVDANGSSDYFEFYVRQNSGGSINIGSNAQTTFASGSKIG